MKLYVKTTKGKGRGVYCFHPIPAGNLIEVCPVIRFEEEKEGGLLKSTSLRDYLFSWGDKGATSVIALGYGSLYNHSFEPNARYAMNDVTGQIEFYSIREIRPHEEITINYNGSPGSPSRDWFDKRNIAYHP